MIKISFVKGIEYLNAYYVNFKFDINDKLAQQIWYQALSDIDDKSFELLVTDYSKKNVYPPQSPTHLLEWFDKMVDAHILKIGGIVKQLEDKHIVIKDTHCYIDYDKAMFDSTDPIITGILGGLKSKVIKHNRPDDIRAFLFKGKNKSIAHDIKMLESGDPK